MITLSRRAPGERVIAADDTVVSPIYVPDLIHIRLNLLIDDQRGIWQLAQPERADLKLARWLLSRAPCTDSQSYG